MSATFAFDEDNGTAAGSPTKGTRTAGVTNANWKNIDDATTAYSASPVLAGNNSFEKWQCGHFSGTYNQILSGLWAHTAGAMGTGTTLKSQPACTTAAGPIQYATPSTAANASLTVDSTSAIAIASGVAVWFGPTGPEAASKAASTTSNPAYTNWLVTQLQSTSSAAPGDLSVAATWTLQYSEN
jgi:hypothetical protein